MTSPLPRSCAQLIESLQVGGAEQLAVRIANAMAAAGHESHLIVIGRCGPLAQFVDGCVVLHELGFERESATRPFQFLVSVWAGLSRLESLISGRRIDLVQSHLPGANFWGLLLTLRRRVAVIPTVHNNQEFNYGDSDHALRARFRRAAYTALVRRCPVTVAVSAAVKESLARDLRLSAKDCARIAVVTNGVDLMPPWTKQFRSQCRAEFGLPAEATVFLAVGRHCEQKNFADLVRAAALLDARDQSWCLVIAGEGPEREGLQAQVRAAGLEGRVRFPGIVLDMTRLRAASDCFVMSSLWEGLPLVLLEAMAAGLPVVATRIPGIRDVVTDGEQGLLVDPADPAALAQGMQRMLLEADFAEACGRSAREVARARFDFCATVGQLRGLYEQSTAGSARSAGKASGADAE